MPNLTFYNNCSRTIMLSVNEGDEIAILPKQTISMLIDTYDILKVHMRQKNKSNLQKKAFQKSYHLTLLTKYEFPFNKDLCFNLTREIHRISGNVYYEKIVLNSNYEIPIRETNYVCEKENIKRIYKKRFTLYLVFMSPFEHLTGLCILLAILGVILWFKWSWKVSIIYLISAYIFLILLDFIIRKISNLFFKKVFKQEDDQTEFYSLLESQYIDNYFNNPMKETYMNDVKIDSIDETI